MSNKSAVIKFLENEYWTTKTPAEIKVVPVMFRQIVYGVNISFPAEHYERNWQDYEKIESMISTITKGAAWINTLFSDYNHGYISIIINIANEQHDDNLIVNLVQKLLKFLKGRRISPPARC